MTNDAELQVLREVYGLGSGNWDPRVILLCEELATLRAAREPKLPYYGDSPHHFCPAHKMVYSECLDQHEPPTEFVFAARDPVLSEMLAAAREWRDVIGGVLTVPPEAYLDVEGRLASAVDALGASGEVG